MAGIEGTRRDCTLPEVGAGQTAEMAVGIERKGVPPLTGDWRRRIHSSWTFLEMKRASEGETKMAATFPVIFTGPSG